MKVLVINSGSSSIKYQLLAMPEGTLLAKGLVEKIGEPEGKANQESDGGAKVSKKQKIADHADGLKLLIGMLTEGEHAPLKTVQEIGAVGHRVVHGGEHFTDSVVIDNDVVAAVEAHSKLAPLHNPPNLLGIRVAREILPKVPQVAVFDTAFHMTLPPHAYRYALPNKYYKEDGIRRYGFHGTSHKYVAVRAAEMLGKPLAECNFITCHLGNGSSMAAIANGKSVDTSMGLTPLEGLVMGTRTGDFDPAIIFHLARTRNMSLDDMDKTFNKASGLIGLSGTSNDVRELLTKMEAGDENAKLALEVFCYRIKKYVGSYVAALGRLDALIFTAGIGENAVWVREHVCAGLEWMGLVIDREKNAAAVRKEADVSGPGARARILVVPTNEEKVIATDTYQLAHASGN